MLSISFSHIVSNNFAFEGNNPKFSVKLLWFRGLGYSADGKNWPILIDTDYDSDLEIIACGGMDNIVAFSHDGKILANISGMKRLSQNPFPFVADYDNDGRLEYFFASDHRIIIIDTYLWRVDDIISFPKDTFITGMIYGNWDEDEDKELLVDCPLKGLYIYDFKDAKSYLIINGSIVSGRQIWVWGPIRPMDGKRIVFFNFPLLYCALGVVDVFDKRVLWAVNISEYGMLTGFDFYVGDFDGDGVKEIVVPGYYPELYIFSGDDGSLEAYFNFTDYVRRGPCTDYFAVCDLNGDGIMEGVFALTPYFGYWSNKSVGILAVINMRSYTIEKLITYSKEEFGYYGISPQSLNILDANLDGVYDILVMNFGNITIYDGRTLTPMFTFNVSVFFKDQELSGFGWAWGTDYVELVVRDIDDDGRVEMVNLCGALSISVYRLMVEPFLAPLIYWNPPYGYLNAFGCFENFDRDHDRVADWVEAQFGFSNNSVDSDGDGVSDFDEILGIYRNMLYGNASPEYLWVFISLVFIPPIAITAVLVYCVRRRKNVGMRPRCESASYSPCLDMLGCM